MRGERLIVRKTKIAEAGASGGEGGTPEGGSADQDPVRLERPVPGEPEVATIALRHLEAARSVTSPSLSTPSPPASHSSSGDHGPVVARLIRCEDFLERPEDPGFAAGIGADVEQELVVIVQHVEQEA